jgi:hypothetical protein
MPDENWYQKYSWLVWVIVALSGLIPAVQLFVAPSSGLSFFAGMGHPVPESILSNPQESAFLEFLLRWIGTVLFGGNILTLFIAATAWRERARWAWIAMWYWPLMFASHYLIYSDGFLKKAQVVWVVLTLLVLGSNYSAFFANSRSERP